MQKYSSTIDNLPLEEEVDIVEDKNKKKIIKTIVNIATDEAIQRLTGISKDPSKIRDFRGIVKAISKIV